VIAHECTSRYVAEPSGPLALVWLRGSVPVRRSRGNPRRSQEPVVHNRNSERAIRTFAGLFGDRDSVVLEIADPLSAPGPLGSSCGPLTPSSAGG
jgi:hypothetical protein